MKRSLHLVTAVALAVFPAVAFAQSGAPEQPAGQMGDMAPQGGMTGHDMGSMAMPGISEASKAYMDAMKKMDAPMMEALQSPDPDVAFVAGMIPHHQGAIDMARAVLTYGKDEQVKAWAEQIIKAQEAEIAEMQAWLKEHRQ
jgi:uncharacterized protein (DUF305 family)